MISGTLAEAARWCDGRLMGTDCRYRGVSTDTRTLTAAALFVAIAGERFDGHDFVADVERSGAAGAVVSNDAGASLPLLRVADTRVALGVLASRWRRKLRTQVVAVTGSNGKTTVKEMLAAILAVRGPILATRGNLNNDIGLPLTLCNLAQEHRVAVVELGCSAPGEIAYLSDIARPDVALINNAGPAHLQGFGTVERIARGKGEIFSGLGPDGIAIFNGDDRYASLWRRLAGERRSLAFGLGSECQLRGEILPGPGNRILVHAAGESVEVALPLPGRHNVMNALAASAAAWAAGESLEAVRAGLERASGVPGRLQLQPGLAGCKLVDDSYNANPASLLAAMELLAAGDGNNWLVLGDMGELGEDGPQLHAEAGLKAHQLGFRRLYTLGQLSAEAAQAFDGASRHHGDLESLVAALRQDLLEAGGDVNVLVKGSRSARMERVVVALRAGAASL